MLISQQHTTITLSAIERYSKIVLKKQTRFQALLSKEQFERTDSRKRVGVSSTSWALTHTRVRCLGGFGCHSLLQLSSQLTNHKWFTRVRLLEVYMIFDKSHPVSQGTIKKKHHKQRKSQRRMCRIRKKTTAPLSICWHSQGVGILSLAASHGSDREISVLMLRSHA